ncbi:Dps family protein [Cellulomonas bogoriensis]|uniref:Ferritin n=1 Tax=Cellulomonas bogoriensis 69B4 = DSM 16987 TaxID=1386082 RepID=A0A0A0BY78_9CELL|nr:DNA starvation/stationary phase protection protein [Cellulomonas bogoriensis]KGM12871.1 ferritin [Cellulomonas bogoriensis 69B4 = DSM 16987]
MRQYTSPLDEHAKTVVGTALNRALVDLVDLSLVAKQAHWNLVGRRFRSLHLQLDEVVDQVRLLADDIAERAVTIGVPPDGRAATVAERSAVPEHPAQWVQDTDVVDYFVTALTAVIGRLREGIAQTETADVVSQDMLIGATAALEKHLWMFQAES